MAAPTLVSPPTTFASNTSGNTITLARPQGVQNGDLLVAALRTNGSTSATDFSMPGWQRRGFVFIPNDPAGRVLGIFTRAIVDIASEPTAYVATKDAADTRRVGALATFRGVDLTNPIAGQAAGWTTNGATVNTHAFSVDTTDEVLLVYAWGAEVVSPNASAPAAPPAGSTSIALVPSEAGTTATRSVLWVGSEPSATTAPGAKSLTWTSASGASAAAIALRAAPAPTEPARGFRSVLELLGKPGATWAHRGGSANWPEMSEYAYDQAVARGYGALEFSAQRTSDGVWVGMHDPSPNRTSQTTGLPNVSAMTWAQLQGYQNSLNSAGTPRPYYRLVDFLDKFTGSHVAIADPKNAIGAHDAEFLDLLDAHGGPRKIVVKFSGVGSGAAALADAAAARGYQTWGYFYDRDLANGDLAAWQSHWSILGMEIGASAEAWAAVKSYGKPITAHIAGSQADYATAISRGARMVQTAAVAAVAPVSATSEQPWDAMLIGGRMVDAIYLGANRLWP